jgi:hypothetical protein
MDGIVSTYGQPHSSCDFNFLEEFGQSIQACSALLQISPLRMTAAADFMMVSG